MAARDNNRHDTEPDDVVFEAASTTEGDSAEGGSAEGGSVEAPSTGGADAEGAVRGGAVCEGAVREGAELEGAEFEEAVFEGAAREGAEFEGAVFEGAVREAAEFEGAEYGGMDALMAALLDEPLPEEALADGEFMAARRAAAADVRMLREQLGLIGDALAGADAGAGASEAEAGAPPGRPVAARPGDAAGAETVTGRRPAPETAPVAPVTPLPTWPARPRRRRRALSVAFGTLAAAAAATVVVGLGAVVVQSGLGGSADDAGSTASKQQDSDSSKDSAGGGNADGKVDPQSYDIACARLIVEGTVVSVEPVPGTERDRVTLDVDRYYKPDQGGKEIVFPLDEDIEPHVKEGDRALVGIPRDGAEPDLWTTDPSDIAGRRAWIETEAREAEGETCR
ncbi:pentapeptide repeat-containing protein [Streptomyces neyagawaensis]|uniref:Pentapeptide repeat-containing protein n=1 Tax=Streptomyces neyagawaensis TaxID=42238 RepID=A0ABV3B0M4_9ACTN